MGREHSPTDDLQLLRSIHSAECVLTAQERAVMTVLILHRNGQTGRCDPSLTTIAEETGLARRTAMRSLAALEEGGCIRRLARRDGHTRTSYVIVSPTRATETLGSERHQGQSDPGLGSESPQTRATVTPERTKERTKERTDPAFEEIWNLHRRGGKAKALEQYRRAVPARVSHEQLVAGLRAYVATLRPDFQGAHLERWIRDSRWEEQTPSNGRVPAAPMRLRAEDWT